MFHIRHTKIEDIPQLLLIFEEAKQTMVENGNPHQWNGAYPDLQTIEEDIMNQHSYVLEIGCIVVATFVFILGDDPTYQHIYQGKWLNDEAYGTVHRLASLKGVRGVGDTCFRWCKSQINNVRVDTHKDNTIMRHLLLKHGFKYCGIIYTASNSERKAYQWRNSKNLLFTHKTIL